MSTAATSGPSPGASLHPVKLSRVPAHWSETSALRHQLAALERDVDEYDRLATKLEGITDEPVWDAMVRTRVCGVVLFLVWWGGRTGCLVVRRALWESWMSWVGATFTLLELQ